VVIADFGRVFVLKLPLVGPTKEGRYTYGRVFGVPQCNNWTVRTSPKAVCFFCGLVAGVFYY